MDSGITSDQNFYSRSAPLQSFGDDDHGHGDIFTMLSDRSKTPLQLSNLDFVATNNVHATTANGYAIDRTASHEDSPDDFYKGYHSHTYNANESGHGNLSNGTAGSDLAHNVPSSLRSNGNGTTPKYPAITGLRTATRPSYRSASAPIDERLSSGSAKCTPTLKGVPKSQQPSVKDLRQRFDPNGNQPSSLPRRPPSQVRNNSPDVTGRYKPTVLAENRQSGTKPGQATREPYQGRVKSPAPPRVAQRGRFATEDHHSNNTLASATRSTKPRNRVSGNVDGSQSMMNLAASSSLPKPIPTDAARKPLFGEIVPAESGSQIAYGISDSRGRARQTSDSGLLPQSSSRRRSYSDLDVSPTSPTAWYLGVTPKLDDVDIQTTPKPTKNHSRSQSDVGGRSIPNGISAMAELEAFKPAEQIQPKAPSRSRLPVSSKRGSISSTSSSPGSTRATSPFIAKMNASINSKLRNPESRPWSPPGHGTTSGRGSSRGHARSPGQVVTSNASLKAYISSPPPMKSPPLRSSRPRLPVSAATTASSRSKMADNAKLAQSRNNITRAESGAQEQERIKRLEFAGPVDYAAKRAWIQQSISKNIQETKQRELEQIEQRELDEARQREEANPQPSEADLQHIGDSTAEPKLVIDTSFLSPSNSLPIQHPNLESTDSDSPTLGLSGSFPKSEFNDDDIPLSAISTVTAVTIFDNELQTEPPRHHSVADVPLVILSSQSGSAPQDAESIPGDFGAVQDGDGSIRIVLDAVSSEEPRFESHRHDHHDLADNEGPMYNSMDGESHPTFTDTEFSSSEPEAESASFIRPPSPDSAFDSQRIAYDSHFEDAGTLPQSNRYSPIQQRSSVSVSDNGMPAETVPTDPVSAWSPRHVLPNHPPASHLPKIDTSLSVSYTAEALAPSDSGSTPVTEIDYDSSEGVDAALDTAYEDNSLTEASTQQTVPQTDSQSWPNFTVEGNNPSSWHENSHRISTSFHEPLGAPPPPPKEPLSSQKPEVPPKPASYIPRLSPRSHGDFSIGQDSDRFSELDSSMTDSNEMNPTSTSSPNSSAIPPIPAPPSWLSEAVSQPTSQSQVDTISSKSGRTPPPSNVWNRHPPPSLHRYSFKDPDSRRGSGEQLYPYRPSTSTARSSGQISLEGDVAETPLSSNDQFSMEASQPNDDGSISETAVATLRHRRMLIQELIDTEAVYLKDMNVVVEIYQGTAEACPKLSVADIKTIFRNSDDVISFSENFLADIKASSTSIYIPRSSKSKRARAARSPESPDKTERPLSTADEESDWTKDQKTTIGANFGRHIEEMEHVYSDFLKNSEQATNRLQALQTDPTVKVWLEECNAVAKDLSGAWDLDALLVKPVQRITRYQLLLTGIVKHTPQDHPDYTLLKKALDDIKVLLDNIDGQKKRIHKVNEIVGGRKRKDSDLRVGLKNPFTRREKVETAVVHNRANEDQVYLKHCDRFHTECMHLQLIVRDVNRYIEYVTNWVEDFLRYLSAIELVVRASPSSYPELESKWARFNLSMRDMGKIALEQHVSISIVLLFILLTFLEICYSQRRSGTFQPASRGIHSSTDNTEEEK